MLRSGPEEFHEAQPFSTRVPTDLYRRAAEVKNAVASSAIEVGCGGQRMVVVEVVRREADFHVAHEPSGWLLDRISHCREAEDVLQPRLAKCDKNRATGVVEPRS